MPRKSSYFQNSSGILFLRFLLWKIWAGLFIDPRFLVFFRLCWTDEIPTFEAWSLRLHLQICPTALWGSTCHYVNNRWQHLHKLDSGIYVRIGMKPTSCQASELTLFFVDNLHPNKVGHEKMWIKKYFIVNCLSTY